MKKLIIGCIAVISVGSLGLTAYFYFKKKQLWNPQPVKVSSSEPALNELESETESPEEEPNHITEFIPEHGNNTTIKEEAKPVSTAIPTAAKDTTAPLPVISRTIPSAKVLSTATIQNSGIVPPSIKPAPTVIKQIPTVVKPVVTAVKPIVKATLITKPITRTPAKVLKPVQKAAIKRLSGDGWFEAEADDMEGRFYSTI